MEAAPLTWMTAVRQASVADTCSLSASMATVSTWLSLVALLKTRNFDSGASCRQMLPTRMLITANVPVVPHPASKSQRFGPHPWKPERGPGTLPDPHASKAPLQHNSNRSHPTMIYNSSMCLHPIC